MKRVAVLLAEDHTIVRQGLRLLIEADGDIEVVGEAKTGREAIQKTGDLHPEIVVMDIAMPQLNGIQATRQILKAFPATKVLILSAHSDPEYVEQVVKEGATAGRDLAMLEVTSFLHRKSGTEADFVEGCRTLYADSTSVPELPSFNSSITL
jgi:chemotaxis response regulator CheB